VLKVLVRLRERPTELTAANKPITISATSRPYSIAVTPVSSLKSLVRKITIGRFHAGFNYTSGIGLSEGEAVGIEFAHVACIGCDYQ
jgi:hypothetical protein